MKKPPTIHELAAELGVSSTTVWRAFQEKARIGEATRRRILARAKALGYAPSQVAQNLSQGRTKTLGVIVPMAGHPVFSALVEKIEEAAFRRGYNIILCNTYLSMERETEYARMLLSRRAEGVIVIPFAERTGGARAHRHLDELRKRGIPVVLLEQGLTPPAAFPSVVADNFGAAHAMTRHLLKLGHRRIAFAFHPVHAWDPVGIERLEGFRRAMAEAKLARQARLLLDAVELEEGPSQVWAYRPESVRACFRGSDRPTALFAGMDSLAIQAMETLRALNLDIPRDVAVAGFDNIDFSQFTRPPLTTVAQPLEAMALRAVELLFERIERGRNGSLSRPVAERLPCRLILRASCGSPFLSPTPP